MLSDDSSCYIKVLAYLSRRELIVESGSVVRLSTISNFSSKTIGPIVTKFYIQPPGPPGKKCSKIVWVT